MTASRDAEVYAQKSLLAFWFLQAARTNDKALKNKLIESVFTAYESIPENERDLTDKNYYGDCLYQVAYELALAAKNALANNDVNSAYGFKVEELALLVKVPDVVKQVGHLDRLLQVDELVSKPLGEHRNRRLFLHKLINKMSAALASDDLFLAMEYYHAARSLSRHFLMPALDEHRLVAYQYLLARTLISAGAAQHAQNKWVNAVYFLRVAKQYIGLSVERLHGDAKLEMPQQRSYGHDPAILVSLHEVRSNNLNLDLLRRNYQALPKQVDEYKFDEKQKPLYQKTFNAYLLSLKISREFKETADEKLVADLMERSKNYLYMLMREGHDLYQKACSHKNSLLKYYFLSRASTVFEILPLDLRCEKLREDMKKIADLLMEQRTALLPSLRNAIHQVLFRPLPSVAPVQPEVDEGVKKRLNRDNSLK